MKIILTAYFAISALVYAFFIPQFPEITNEVEPVSEIIITTTTTIPPTTTTTIPRTDCEKVKDLARIIGWAESELDNLIKIVYRESRCSPSVINKTLNKDGSYDYGLLQINDKSWCKPTRYHENGYLQKLGLITTCDDLLNPIINLSAGLMLFDYSNGWRQWE